MKIFGISLAYILTIAVVMTGVECWEDHPDIEDHKDTDRMLREADRSLGAEEYMTMQLQKEYDESLKNFKNSKFRKKNVEISN